ncbi:HAD-like domain-containing protein, partial [Coniochaeta sp. 2T2.1]
PSPSEVYLLRASLLPRTLPLPQPLLVIIDLNGTLLYRPNSHKAPRHFVLRPGAAEFLSFCLSSTQTQTSFKVMIWSSARPANVAAMLDKLPLTKSQRSDLVAVWGRDKFGLSPEDYTRRVQCYKRLTKVWADPLKDRTEEAGGWVKGGWSQGNTVLIDDSKEKARSEPYNAVEIPEFRGDMTEDVLPRVRGYLEGLARQADVSTYMRVSPFKPV